MELKIYPSKVFKILLILIIFLILANTAGLLSTYLFGHSNVYGLVPLFHLDREANVPTWYSSTTLFVCSILLGIIAFTKKIERDRYRLHWGILSIFFLYLSIDEAAGIHELTMRPLEYLFNLEGIFHFSWVIIGIPLVFIFVIAYAKFVINLPRKIGLLFILSGVLFVGGALGMELIDGWYAFTTGEYNLMYQMMTMLEEMLEMIGIAVFIYSLLTYIRTYVKEVVICVI
ncbi:MAG: hypothetical protein KAT65_09625 [Methanophagales archaeon]|nr:hypothetical protein [Methanophagales archaeon]